MDAADGAAGGPAEAPGALAEDEEVPLVDMDVEMDFDDAATYAAGLYDEDPSPAGSAEEAIIVEDID